jgi:hypothetical protein
MFRYQPTAFPRRAATVAIRVSMPVGGTRRQRSVDADSRVVIFHLWANLMRKRTISSQIDDQIRIPRSI